MVVEESSLDAGREPGLPCFPEPLADTTAAHLAGPGAGKGTVAHALEGIVENRIDDQEVRLPIPDVEVASSTDSKSIGDESVEEAFIQSSTTRLSCSFTQHPGERLSWTNVNMIFTKKKGEESRYILKDVWGQINPGETTALMGPSGAGKTSLFNILAGRAVSKGPISISAEVSLGGAPLDASQFSTIRKKIAFVAQEDALHETSTPREAIRFSARLRLPVSTSDEDIDDVVDLFVKELGLQSCADTVIGGGLKKGISGGEKKRTSVGVELVTRPSIVLLDEPTSGLDSFSAEQVCNVLSKVAKAGTAVLFTIHQPSTDVFESFDKVLLMSRGRIMYNGKVSEVETKFDLAGYTIPPHYNPAEWMMRVAQASDEKELENVGFFPEDDRVFEEDAKSSVSENSVSKGNHVSFCVQLAMLFQREKRSLIRRPAPLIANLVVTAILSLIYGIFFWGVGRLDRTNPTDTQAQLGALVNVLISTLMGQSQLALTSFPVERPLFLREYSTNHYAVVAYFMSKLSTEVLQSALAILLQSTIIYLMIGFQLSFGLFFAINFALSLTSTAVAVMLGSALSDPHQAPMLYTLFVVPQFYFSGVFSPLDLVPEIVRWAQYLCSLRYAAGLSMIYEFGDCKPGLEELNCQNILDRNNVSTDDAWWMWLGLIGLFVVFRLVALIILRFRATTFG